MRRMEQPEVPGRTAGELDRAQSHHRPVGIAVVVQPTSNRLSSREFVIERRDSKDRSFDTSEAIADSCVQVVRVSQFDP